MRGRHCDLVEGVILPARASRFVARGPRFGRGIVGKGIAQLERRAARIGELRPRTVVAVEDLVHHVAEGVLQRDALPGVGKISAERANRGDAGMRGVEGRDILRDHDECARCQTAGCGKGEADPAGQLPAGEIDRRAGPVEKLDPLLRTFHKRRRAVAVLRAAVIHDFVDHHACREHDVIGRAGRLLRDVRGFEKFAR